MTAKAQKWVPTDRATFEAMDAVGKRKAIARDVLAGIDAGVLKGHRGKATFSLHAIDAAPLYGNPDRLVHEVTSCFVCGVGAPLVAAGRIADQLSERYDSDGLWGGAFAKATIYLSEWFPKETMNAVEAAYEQGRGVCPIINHDLALSFAAYRYGTPRLRAIWEYVANHPEGLFEPVSR